ncbi:Hypothetical membrane protein [Zobellia galactanivorans]|uniref:Hypothetical membrane protein n=1 Tax=Zobellia galactanivorans (strain DSM 12802 / CCUG 47099 / CIP 106680 / NCIMB 13871 / Dsij) TaxID=63186 RepID=G0L778_ZOBGA|nr:Hypothetical membrane protein [Zobellia galactanivorans]
MNLSTKAFWVGSPGWIYLNSIPYIWLQSLVMWAMNSGPLSILIFFGFPFLLMGWLSVHSPISRTGFLQI